MDSFHIITLVVASVSLILVLTIVGILLKNDEASQKFPTSYSDVPHGWEKTTVTDNASLTTGYKLKQKNNSNNPVGNADDTVNDKTFTTTGEWKDIDICIKKLWADQNNVYWDGITTYNGC